MSDTAEARKAEAPQSEVWAAWENNAREVLLRAMKQRAMSYKALSRRLEALGIYETPDWINRKVNRTRFSAAFLLACLEATQADMAGNANDS